MDLQIDNQFNSVFKQDLALTNGINEQKQRLFIFLKTPKGSIKNAPHWGFDYDLAARFAKTSSLTQIKTYLSNIIQDLRIDAINIETTIINKKLNITFEFANDTLNMEIKI
ncbi:Hypothetical protein BPA_0035600 (plasmid) [Borrelia parkeri SLO]|uniref:Uncharacterized protein n=1 Tax=Borrelia parkeri SLO TaxID=1313294 RepID=W5STL4_BORPR|nr:hypothetical protein [Borrelia parkeri]AHH10033.1 Hypothetical protein BPA_0035600 [Borrelia parkeri SLO]UPA11065.1 hypothetical protein bpSLO_000878 [Borrelia parkeri]UPA11102.1 hypothetical protein bpSLO_000920 [Borrelia parkeri]UPA11122.1 hypothetical protein bpSLO_001003 [Borrelia parkeri]UPA11160.1 hypothetical protein bpSLO_000961 [Borrelia parkeri]